MHDTWAWRRAIAIVFEMIVKAASPIVMAAKAL